MPKITKFDGYVVRPDHVQKVVTPAYDAMLPSERRAFAEEYPGNYVNVMRTLEEFSDSGPTLDEILDHNQSHFNKMLEDGAFARTRSPAFYLYRLQSGGHEQTGLIADIPVSDYTEGRLKKHEDTQIEKENMLTRYQETVGVTSSPVCVAYADRDDITDAVAATMKEEPLLDFSAWDDVGQTIWRVSDAAVEAQLQAGFEQITYTYLTDGHHRCASGARFARIAQNRQDANSASNADRLLVALFPESQLRIFSYFRCVRDLNGMDVSALIRAIESTGIRVESQPMDDMERLLPRKPREITMIVDDSAYRLNIPQELVPQDDPAGSLDVSILQEQVLAPVLGIADARSDGRLSYTPGVEGVSGLIDRCRKGWSLGFACVDTTIQEVVDVADAGQAMPPKSTWFDPKLRAGIFVRYC